MRRLMLGLMMAAMPVVPVFAQERPDPRAFDGNTMLSLSAQARTQVAEDRLTAALQIEKLAKDAAEAQRYINAKMQAAQAQANKTAGVKVSTGNYSVYKQYTPEPPVPVNGKAWSPEQREKNASWQASQQLILDGADKDVLLKLVGDLQKDGFAVQNLSYYLSAEARDKVKDELAAQALGTIKERAEKLSAVLGTKKVEYVWIDVNDGNGGSIRPPMMVRAMAFKGAEASDAVAPVAQAGESEVVVGVSAHVKLMK